MQNGGNTRSDAKFDVDGAIATLLAYAELGTALGAGKFLVDGEGIQLGRSPRFHGQHLSVLVGIGLATTVLSYVVFAGRDI